MHLFTSNFCPVLKTGLFLSLIFCSAESKAQFTTGNLTVLQVGDGSSALVNTGNVIVLKEYSPAGALTYSMAVPSTGTNALVVSGSASSEGFLSLSADKKQLVFGGYAKALPNTTALSGATASSINRGIGMVGSGGLTSYSMVATSTTFFTGSNIRGAAAADHLNCWATGGSQGTNYFGSASAPVTVQNTKTNLRAVNIFNGQLYCSSQVASGTPADIGVYSVGTGTPLTNGQMIATVINTGTGSQPAQFYFNTAGTICYVADQRNTANGGIQKWIQNTSAWTLAYTLATGTTAVGATGVAVDFFGTNPLVYATTNESNTNRLIAINDVGATATATTLAIASTTGTVFKGLAFSPCSAPTVSATSSATTICAGQALTLQALAAGSSPLSYFWAGPGSFVNPNLQNATATALTSGIYTVTAANACGTETATVSVSINPAPALVTNSAVICSGQAATLTASGANSYLWDTGSTSVMLIVNPTSTTLYTLTGTGSNGCTKTLTTQVMVSAFPLVTVNSATLCSGNTATLNAGGANSYTWSTGISASSVMVSPVVTTTYTVLGSLAGCAGISTASATVNVLPSPALSISGASVTCGGSAVSQTVSGALSYTWNSGSSSDVIVVSPLVTTVYSVNGTGSNGCIGAATSTINFSATPVLTITSNPEYICLGLHHSATLTVLGATSYTWNSGATGSVITLVSPTVTTTYTAAGTMGPNCNATASYQLRVTICEDGIKDYPNDIGMMLYPNPASDHLQIGFINSDEKYLSIVNASGQLVYSQTVRGHEVTINLNNFKKGLYTLLLYDNGKRTGKKIVID